MKYCPWCGGSLIKGAAFCAQCGRDLRAARPADAAGGKPLPMEGESISHTDEPTFQADWIPHRSRQGSTIHVGSARGAANGRDHGDHSANPSSAAMREGSLEAEEPEEQEEWEDEDEYEDEYVSGDEYYDDVPAEAQPPEREGLNQKLVLKIAMVGCGAAVVILLAVVAVLFL